MKMWLVIQLVIALTIAIGAISLLLKSSKWPNVAATIVSSNITEIYYNPKKPQQSALFIPTSNKKGNPLALYLIGLVVVIFIGAGIYIAPKI